LTTSPLDLVKNQKIDTGKSLSQYNRKEYHHIFPQAFLKKQSVSYDKIFNVLNFCFLSSGSNKIILSKAPSDYFFNCITSDSYIEVLNSNVLPVDKSIYKTNNFDEFLDKRANLIISKIDELANR
jgi:hypothetical protein